MSDDFPTVVEQLIRKAPPEWLTSACEALRSVPASTIAEVVLQRLPVTRNANLAYLMTSAVRLAAGQMSWEALSWTLQTTSVAYRRWQTDQHVELLWAGPSPADRIPARRIDQALYDLIDSAKREILLVTFAAAKIERLSSHLWKAAQRGVRIRLVLEFEQSSEGQLTFDALKAFPPALINACDVYHWPVERRERNLAGRPGKLHAKVAIVDDSALVSSANLTDDAFNRNLEIGVMVTSTEFLISTKAYIESLIAEGTLCQLSGNPICN
jgi:phosphatidylserine/phosphatidylglycerophosphate/cardiolipin synthase-like enzyme